MSRVRTPSSGQGFFFVKEELVKGCGILEHASKGCHLVKGIVTPNHATAFWQQRAKYIRQVESINYLMDSLQINLTRPSFFSSRLVQNIIIEDCGTPKHTSKGHHPVEGLGTAKHATTLC